MNRRGLTTREVFRVCGAALVAVVALCVFISEARACDWVDSMVYSQHARHAKNSRTVGLGCENAVSPDLRQMHGAYDNSSNHFSAYAGYVWAPIHRGEWHYGVLGGMVTGYRPEKFAPMPLGGLTATWEGKEYGLNITAIPANGGVVNFILKRRWQ